MALILNKKWILAAMVFLTILFNADYTAVSVILTTVSKFFNAPIPYIQWVLSGYTLVWATLSVPGGKFADFLGHKRAILIGTSIFGIGSLLGGSAFTAWFLILSRGIQSMGAAICLPAIYGIIITRLSEKQQKTAFGLISSSAAMGLIIGPMLSSVLMRYCNWRFIFFINMPIVAFSFYVFSAKLDNYKNTPPKKQLNYFSLILFIFAIICFVLFMNKASALKLVDIKTMSLLVLSICFFVLFFYAQKHFKMEPLIRMSLFKIKPYLVSNLLYIATTFNFVFSLIIFGLYLQNVKHYHPSFVGLIFVCLSGAFGCISLITPKLLKSLSTSSVTLAGELLTIVGFIISFYFSANTTLPSIIGLQLIMGTALGLLFPAFNTKMALCLPKEVAGEGASVFLMIGLLFSSMFAALSTMVLNFLLQTQFFDLLKYRSIPISIIQKAAIVKMLSHASLSFHDLVSVGIADPEKYLSIFYSAFCYAMHNIAIIGVTLNLVAAAVIITTFQKKNG